MLRRSLSTGILIALLMSAWVNVLAAAFCPRSAQDHACCYMKQNVDRHEAHKDTHQHSGHEQMAGMLVDNMQVQPRTEQKAETDAVSRIGASCTHCVSHSQLPAPPATLRDADQSKRSDNQTAPQLPSASILTLGFFIPSALPRQHGPPGATTSSARHVLINVFRI